MKKVLIIAGAPYIGGAERVARDIGFYAKGRFEVHYLVFGEEVGAYETELLDAGCRIFHTAPPSSGHAAYYQYLCRLIRREKYDVIHAHTMFNSGLAMLAGKHCGVPVRISHSHSALTVYRSLGKRAYEALMRKMILRYATHYVACGQQAGERLYGRKAFLRSGIVMLNGIDTDAFRYDPKARKAIRESLGIEDRFVIGHVGHLAEVKNQSFLIDLMPKILQQRADACLILLGEGVDRAKLERQIKNLGLQNQVIMTGNVSNVNEYLSAMDVFAFPSLYEGMPLTIVEVQANGLPCIISDRVPRDVFVTELLESLPLEDANAWIRAILQVSRTEPEKYADAVKKKGLDVSVFLDRIYQLYSMPSEKE